MRQAITVLPRKGREPEEKNFEHATTHASSPRFPCDAVPRPRPCGGRSAQAGGPQTGRVVIAYCGARLAGLKGDFTCGRRPSFFFSFFDFNFFSIAGRVRPGGHPAGTGQGKRRSRDKQEEEESGACGTSSTYSESIVRRALCHLRPLCYTHQAVFSFKRVLVESPCEPV